MDPLAKSDADYSHKYLGAGWVIGKLAASRAVLLALVLGALLTLANVYNLVNVPHPLWLAVLNTVTFLPLTWLGARAAGPRAG